MAKALVDLRDALSKLEAIREEGWTKDNFAMELTRALTALENARMEWNTARLKFPILSGPAPEGSASSREHRRAAAWLPGGAQLWRSLPDWLCVDVAAGRSGAGRPGRAARVPHASLTRLPSWRGLEKSRTRFPTARGLSTTRSLSSNRKSSSLTRKSRAITPNRVCGPPLCPTAARSAMRPPRPRRRLSRLPTSRSSKRWARTCSRRGARRPPRRSITMNWACASTT